jgi:hypothetical protein
VIELFYIGWVCWPLEQGITLDRPGPVSPQGPHKREAGDQSQRKTGRHYPAVLRREEGAESREIWGL